MLMPGTRYVRAVVLTVLAAGCSTEPATSPQDSDAADEAALAEAASGAGVDLSALRGTRIRLFESSCATTFAITEFVPLIGADGNPVIGPDGKPVPARFTVSIAGECRLMPFGNASLTGTQQVVFNADGSQSLHSESQYALGSGDVLRSTFDGTGAASAGDPTKVKLEGWERFAGGTGAFTRARGGARALGSADLATGQGKYRTLGVIGY